MCVCVCARHCYLISWDLVRLKAYLGISAAQPISPCTFVVMFCVCLYVCVCVCARHCYLISWDLVRLKAYLGILAAQPISPCKSIVLDVLCVCSAFVKVYM